MATIHRPSIHRFPHVLIVSLVIAGALVGCAGYAPRPEPAPELAGLELALQEKEAQIAELEKKYTEATQEAGRTKVKLHSLESKAEAASKLALLEKEAQIAELEKKYTEAIQEVVRTKAKLHSLESKAEAASTMAEAEIALKALGGNAAGPKDGPEAARARQLLQMSAQEFKNENYGGALYLASQAKGLVQVGQGRLVAREAGPSVSGEVLFALPLPLQASANSNVRRGPGLEFEVAFTADKGTFLVGHSYKGMWVRVRDEAGRAGWIHQTLVDGRPAARP